MSLINNLKWRYATKSFDTTQAVAKEDLQKIKEAIQLTATSYGLELYKVLIVQTQEIKDQLLPVSWNQQQVAQAPYVLVFTALKKLEDTTIDNHISYKAKFLSIDEEKLKGYGDFMKNTLSQLSDEQVKTWTQKQTYIALGNALAMCAELKIDSCPMEGFDAQKYDEILNLTDSNYTSTLVLPIGYRSEEDQTQHMPKVRKPLEDLFELV